MGNQPPHRARKRFGQNFLHDKAVISRIVSAIRPEVGQRLVEIGPGQGAITKEILKQIKNMDVIELDRDLIEPLARTLGELGEVRIHNKDAMKFDYVDLAGGDRLRVVGNLPYNISTPILFHLLSQAECIEDMHFMLQKEVVDRMAAPPGNKTYGKLSVMLQVWCEIEHLFDIHPGAFNPAPKVNSAFVRLIPRPAPIAPVTDNRVLEQVVTSAFSQRRKTLRNSLRKLIDAEALESLGINPTLRAERLTLEEFITIANYTCNNPLPT